MIISPIEVSLVDSCGSDLSVVNAARVSFDKESTWMYEVYTGEDEHGPFTEEKPKLSYADKKLIRYLAKHKHFSPFNHTFMTVRVKAPIFVARQLVKHKFMPWNEVSRRYVDSEPEFYFPEEWRAKAENAKQGSSNTRCEAMYINVDKDWLNEDIPMPLDDVVHLHLSNLVLLYNEMIEKGVCPEQARMVLPQNTMTEWMWSGTLGAFCDMLRLRIDPHTQHESRIVANKIYNEIQPLFPVSVEALLGEQDA